MSRVQDAFLAGREASSQGRAAGVAAVSAFDRGVAWARDVLLPALERANADLGVHGVQFRVDTNLDPRSTNHAHVDFWIAPTAEQSGGSPHGLRHSINVRDGGDVWLYRHGDSGEKLGTVETMDADACETMLARAAGDYARTTG
ncbi:hypothetical protein [Rhodoplanes roseus]|uniref:Uncharacterized protein n=1 Tax=Rhodoplanes roseus TaxID=29409 RepID=A0A327KRB9_9BRAD|nr:hypothetical protein [Rhodoplanes roseus]RAI40817.1 hypothetical protein CH341_22995 [Rhodoplanes roseus]